MQNLIPCLFTVEVLCVNIKENRRRILLFKKQEKKH